MTDLTAGELSDLRADLADLALDTATISRPATASDGLGGQTLTYASAGSIACRLNPAGSAWTQQAAGGQYAGRPIFELRFTHGSDIRLGDRLTIGGLTYEVFVTPDSTYDLTKLVIASQL